MLREPAVSSLGRRGEEEGDLGMTQRCKVPVWIMLDVPLLMGTLSTLPAPLSIPILMQIGEKRQLLKAAYGYRGSSLMYCHRRLPLPVSESQMSQSSQTQAPRPDVLLLYWQQQRRRAVGGEC